MQHRTNKLQTTGEMARQLGQSYHRIAFVLRTRPHIRCAARAGQLRLYDRAAVAQVRHELNAMDARRSRHSKARGGADV